MIFLVSLASVASGCSASSSTHSTYDRTFASPSNVSMEPTIQPGDTVGVSTHFSTLQRGTVVVFHTPPQDNLTVAKRIVGLPGETISSAPDGRVLINGQPIDEPWLSSSEEANPGPLIRQMTIPQGEYWVLGDYRSASEDSRFFGPVPKANIEGVAVSIVAPPSRAGPIAS